MPFPKFPGYAAVAEVVEIGPEVETVSDGDVVLCPGTHSDVVRCAARDATPVPPGLLPRSRSSRGCSASDVGCQRDVRQSSEPRPRDGTGPIGNLAAQVVSACGFTVTSVDPVVSRRDLARACGLSDVRADLGEAWPISRTLSEHTSSAAARSSAVMSGLQTVPPRRDSCWWAFRGAARPMSRRTHSSTRSFGVTSASRTAGVAGAAIPRGLPAQ